MSAISRRRGLVTNTESRDDIFIMNADCPLSQMFGFATELRGMTAGQVTRVLQTLLDLFNNLLPCV